MIPHIKRTWSNLEGQARPMWSTICSICSRTFSDDINSIAGRHITTTTGTRADHNGHRSRRRHRHRHHQRQAKKSWTITATVAHRAQPHRGLHSRRRRHSPSWPSRQRQSSVQLGRAPLDNQERGGHRAARSPERIIFL